MMAPPRRPRMRQPHGQQVPSVVALPALHSMRMAFRFATMLSVVIGALADTCEVTEGIQNHTAASPDSQDWLPSPSLWTAVAVSVLAIEFLGGFMWLRNAPRNVVRCYISISDAFALLHLPVQFLPLICFWSDSGLVDCNTGLWWPVHWGYTLVMTLALPTLCGLRDFKEQAEVPCLGWRGSLIAQLYAYVTTILVASDQYLDSMTAAIAGQCKWRFAWVMVAVIFASYILQALTALYASGHTAMLWSLVGSNPESVALDEKKGGAADINTAAFAASQGVSKLATENAPQAYLAVKFAEECKPSKMVWVSVAMSAILASKSFLSGVSYFCGWSEEEDKSTEEEDDSDAEEEE